MRIKSTYLFALLLFGLCVSQVFAADNNPPPADLLGWVNMVIVALTPIVIAGIKKLVPVIPGVMFPFIAPVVGLILNWISTFATGHAADPVVGAITGALGLWLRELVDQTKQTMTSDPGLKSP